MIACHTEAKPGQSDATVLQTDATVLQLDETVLHEEATVLQDESTVLHDEATVLQLEATVLQEDATLPCGPTRWEAGLAKLPALVPAGLGGMSSRTCCGRLAANLGSRHARATVMGSMRVMADIPSRGCTTVVYRSCSRRWSRSRRRCCSCWKRCLDRCWSSVHRRARTPVTTIGGERAWPPSPAMRHLAAASVRLNVR